MKRGGLLPSSTCSLSSACWSATFGTLLFIWMVRALRNVGRYLGGRCPGRAMHEGFERMMPTHARRRMFAMRSMVWHLLFSVYGVCLKVAAFGHRWCMLWRAMPLHARRLMIATRRLVCRLLYAMMFASASLVIATFMVFCVSTIVASIELCMKLCEQLASMVVPKSQTTYEQTRVSEATKESEKRV